MDDTGRFSVSLPACRTGRALLFQAQVRDESGDTIYSTLDIGSPSAGGGATVLGRGATTVASSLEGLVLSPNSEATTRLVLETGLENFGNETTPIILQVTRSSGEITPCLQVVSPANTSINFSTCGNPSARLDLLLPPDTYYVYVDDQDETDVGSYDLIYLRVAPEDAQALSSEPVNGAIGPVGDLDPYAFTLGGCSQVRLQGTQAGGTVSPCLELRAKGANEALANDCGDSSVSIDVQLPAGSYVVLFSDRGNDDVRSYTLQLSVIPSQPGSCGPLPTPTFTPTTSQQQHPPQRQQRATA